MAGDHRSCSGRGSRRARRPSRGSAGTGCGCSSGEELTDAEADAWFERYLVHYEAAWSLFPDVLPALDALAASHRHAVLSNSSIHVQDRKLRALGVHDRFEAVLCAAELGVSKPEAGAFLAGLRRPGAGPAPGGVRRRPPGDRRARRRRRRAAVRLDRPRRMSTRRRRARRPAPDRLASPNSPRSSAPIPVLERRPPSGNVLPAPPESGPKGRPEAQARTRSPQGLAFRWAMV